MMTFGRSFLKTYDLFGLELIRTFQDVLGYPRTERMHKPGTQQWFGAWLAYQDVLGYAKTKGLAEQENSKDIPIQRIGLVVKQSRSPDVLGYPRTKRTHKPRTQQ